MAKLSRLLAVSAGVVFCAAAHHVALGAGQSAAPQFKASVDATTLNVVVVDQNQKPVRGLSREDFTVLEDGKPQRIVSFSEEALRRNAGPAPVWSQKFSSDVTTNIDDKRRLVMILMTYGLDSDPWVTLKRKQIAHAIVDRLGPDDSAAVIWTHRSDDSQDFTSDRAKLHAAIERTRLGTPFAKPRCVKQFLAEAFAAFPEKRKVLINVGSGNSSPSLDSKMPTLTRPGASEFNRFMKECPGAPHSFDAMVHRSNIIIYNISPLGVGADGFDADENPSGGRTLGNSNTPERYVEEVFAENDSFYVIAYESSSSKPREAFRKISVSVNRPGVEVHAPENWYETGPTAKEIAKNPKKAPSPLMKAMSEVLPSSRVALRTVVTPFASTNGKAAVAIVLGMTLPGEKRGDAAKETVQVEQRAYDLEAHLRGTQTQTAAIALLADGADARLELLSKMELKPGRYQIRTSISSAVLKETASIYSDVFVPDFFDKPITLSGLGLAVDPGVSAAPKDAFAGLMPIVPTSQRDFTADSSAEVFVRIYQKKPVDVTMVAEIRDAANKVVAHEERLVPVDRFTGSRSADFRWNMPLSKLPAGPYLLTLTSTANKATAMQSLQFAVR